MSFMLLTAVLKVLECQRRPFPISRISLRLFHKAEEALQSVQKHKVMRKKELSGASHGILVINSFLLSFDTIHIHPCVSSIRRLNIPSSRRRKPMRPLILLCFSKVTTAFFLSGKKKVMHRAGNKLLLFSPPPSLSIHLAKY